MQNFDIYKAVSVTSVAMFSLIFLPERKVVFLVPTELGRENYGAQRGAQFVTGIVHYDVQRQGVFFRSIKKNGVIYFLVVKVGTHLTFK